MVETDILPALQRAADWLVDSPLNAIFALVVAVVVAHVIPFITATHAIGYPGPLLAKFSDFWLVRQAQKGKRFVAVHELHQKHGKFVRLAPNHISIADHRALNAVYGHGTGTMKSEYYDAFVPPRPAVRGVFNTRDRQEHSRKRRIVAHSFAPKSIISFEEFIRREVALLLERWDEFCDKAKKEGTKGPRGLVGYAWLDSLMWLNYFAFDTIGTLAFGKTFGMLENGKDEASVDVDDGKGGFVTSTCSAVETINLRGEVSSTLGLVPVWLRPLVLKHPWFSHRLRAVKTLTGIALARVNDRLENGSERDDLLAKLQAATDDSGQPMGKAELTAEALTQLIAGSDTTSNTACAILHHLGTTPRAMKKLQEELDRELLDKEIVDESGVPRMDDVNELPYLQAVLSESLRYHSTSSLGLPRILPPQGATICGRFFPGGSVLSVPAYTIHRDPEVWGKDAEEYNPDRWLPEGARKEFDKSFVPFSVGPRACVGRNVAMAELSILIAAIIMRYDIVLESPEKPLEKVEGFLVKPTELQIGLKRRH